ncbi:dihydrolipoyllysine-residue acetyltransferase [Extensimonas vulgaris]|uniref:Dihydrolipoamide acetyltransferase component of pyruvate dehydrogenase complex n=1 Tax=Extensimonas vulgaris TaxID=1031594 RepID=A0A369AIS3_9BURK|nr:dihydrolipoyllysine-residue acetyltransferase [Extensimonas vulgaris]RCX09013.1 pyruvate dehydrogenase E2 component (dihydrolipoamide acetyltransferase) [Extensimonas vulgaris]TWI37249.1 pyruvate dehydrogenase E2 component (dihydrolipoamide acetyltransferase) [Extensimonas vulgaris]TXD14265.1 dihydrolipoyllysine-residue acetyltransferase [Extensimonas vulgaris]
MAIQEIKVPDIGNFDEVTVIEILVKPGDTVQKEQSLVTVESDKASMEIPSSHAGVVQELRVKLGDKVHEGSVLLTLDVAKAQQASAQNSEPNQPPAQVQQAQAAPKAEAIEQAAPAVAASMAPPAPTPASAAPAAVAPAAASLQTPHQPDRSAQLVHLPHASPAVRRFARELGVPLEEVQGTGPKGRITIADVQAFTQAVMRGTLQTRAAAAQRATAAGAGAGAPGGAGLNLLPWPQVDFAKFGPIERKDLSRIQKISGANLHRNWVMIPHVTNHDDADVTDLEALRQQLNEEQAKAGIKVTLLAFMIKAAVAALRKFPQFNASLDGEQLVLKKYFHIGFAADTPNGLVVPVVRDADQKGILEIAQETAALSQKAREGKLTPADMTGGCFSISSLGGIGGRYFTPIINAPEVAILGVCKSHTEPQWDGQQFVPRLMLPLSLSWDHRVIDGAAAARFLVYFTGLLADFRRVSL